MSNIIFRKGILYLYLIIISYSCKTTSTEAYELINCTIEYRVDTLPDSTFMSDVIKLQAIENDIYFIERSSNQLIKLDKGFNNNKRIGRWGVGPQELTDPVNFFIFNGLYYIIDIGSGSIKYFSPQNKFIGSEKVNSFSEQRVLVYDNHLYMAFFDRISKKCYTRIGIGNNKNDWTAESFGESFEFENSLQNIIRNKRDLLVNGDFFYSISDNQPIIEKYNTRDKSKLESFDYSFIPLIKDNLKIIDAKPVNPNSYTAFVRDSYIYNDAIYLLISQQGDKFTANKILHFNIDLAFELKSIYHLPGDVYSTFCVDDNSFYAFNSETASIEKINK